MYKLFSVLIGVILFGFTATVHADWVLKQEVISTMGDMPGFKGIPAEKQIQTFYTRNDAMRMEKNNGESIIIKRQGARIVAYQINTRHKTYSDVTPMLPMMAMGAMFYLDCNQQGQCKKRSNLISNAGKQSKKVGKFNATRASMLMPQGAAAMMPQGASATVWLTKDSTALINEERARMLIFAEILNSVGMAGLTPGLVLSAYDDIAGQYGVAVETEIDMQMIKVTTRTVSIQSKTLANDLFKVPAGYKKIAGLGGLPGLPN